MKTTFIYTLTDSYTGQVRYVGKSDNPSSRLNKHILESKHKRTHKENWISNMILTKTEILLEVVDEVPDSEWSFWESYWIMQMKTWGFDLTNGTAGGEGGNGFKGKKHSEVTREKCRLARKKAKTVKSFGERNGKAKLTSEQICAIKEKVNSGCSRKNIASEYGICTKYIYHLLKGLRRKNG